MKTHLQKLLATLAPSIAIETHWSHDQDANDFGEGVDWTEGEDPDDWQAWQSEVRAEAVIRGELVCGSAYLGGTYERSLMHPSVSNPEISGYENQITVEALEDLRATVERLNGPRATVAQINRAIARCAVEAARSYAAQMVEAQA